MNKCIRPTPVVNSFVNSYSYVFFFTGGTTYLLSGETLVHANKLQFLNDVVMTSEGVIYFSQTSLRWTVKDFMWTGLENADDGRSPKTLYFADE